MKTMKKFISVLLVAVLVISTMATTGFAWTGDGTQQIKYSLTADKEFVSAGDTVTFTFTMETSEDATWTTFGNFLYSFMYNNTVLTPVSYEWGPIIAEFAQTKAIGIVTAATTLTNNVYNKSTADEKTKYTADGINAMARFQCAKDANTTYGSQGYWELQPGESTVLFTITCEVAEGVADNTPVSFDYYSGLGVSKYFYVQTIDTSNNNKGTNQTTMTYYDVTSVTSSSVVGTPAPACDHAADKITWTQVTAPTCTAEGSEKGVCSCGEDMGTRAIAATGHTEGAAVKENETAASCTGTGSYDTVVYCTVCNEEISRKTTTVDALGHTAAAAVVENSVAATCTTDGSYDTVVYCSVCNAELSRETTKVDALGHSYTTEVTAPTCTAEGYTTYTCTVCGDTKVDDKVAALGHSYNAVVTAPTCTADGYTTYTCTACNDTYTADVVAALGHDFSEVDVAKVEATCTADGKEAVMGCSRCDATEGGAVIPATGHTEAAAVVENEVAATCTADGSYDTVVYCSVCNAELSRETTKVDALGHTAAAAVVENEVAATCTTDGSYDTVVYCSVCSAEISRVTTTVDALGHSYTTEVTAPTCTAEGYTTYTCTVCGDTKVDDKVAALGHSYTTEVTAPTCTAEGYTTYTCTACNDTYTADVVAALGHDFSEVDVAKVEATCTADGKEAVMGCSRCDATEGGAVIPATGHTEAAAVVENEVAATCTTDGSYDTVVYCSVCDAELSRVNTVVPATGHTEGAVVVENEVAATCGADGSYDNVVYCTVCDAELSRDTVVVPATGAHVYAEVVDEKAATCTEDGYVTKACGCGATDTTVVPATGHTEAAAVVENEVAATCTADGSYDTVVYCSVCNEELSRVNTVVPATGHTAGAVVVENEVAATCGADGSYDNVVYCTVCDAELSRDTVVVPATGAHVYAEVVDEKAATCTEDGYIVKACGCGATDTTVVPATGHTEAAAVVENEVAATCTADGSYDTVVYCSVCDAELSRETTTVDALGHKYESVVTAPTCTADGYTTYTCSVCGDTYTADVVAALGHTAADAVVENEVAATCGADGSYDSVVYCSVCNAELSRETVVVKATGAHVYAEVVDEKAATCTDDGYVTKACGCGATETTVVPATGHTEAAAVVENEVAATCTADGSYDTVVYCSVCDAELSRETTTVDALGHTAGAVVVENEVAASCGADGSYDNVVYCTVCDAELSRETVPVPATGAHVYAEVVDEKAATCTEDGYIVKACACGARETTTVDALGHTAAAAVVENEVAATCTADGSYDTVVYCSVCDAELSRETTTVDALGHSYTTEVTAPTCTAEGYTTYTCTVCGDTYVADYVDALGHTYTSEETKAPTYTEAGVMTYTCACGHTYTEVIPMKSLVAAMKGQIRFRKNADGTYAGRFDIRAIAEMKKADFLAAFGSQANAEKMIKKFGFVFAKGSVVAADEFDMAAVKDIVENGASYTGYTEKTLSQISTSVSAGNYAFTCMITDIPDADQNDSLVAVGFMAWDSDNDGEVDTYAYYPAVQEVEFYDLYSRNFSKHFGA